MNSSRGLFVVILVAALALLSFDARPALGATFTVDHTGDGGDDNIGNGICAVSPQGQCTLRAAIQEANAAGGADTIAFNIPSGTTNCSGTACTITPSPQLPVITSPVTIDGFTQPGATPNTNPVTQGSNAVLNIRLAGPSMGSTTALIITASNSTVRGLAINGFREDAIFLSGGSGNTIAGNHIGTGPVNEGAGVFISSSSNNTIGGETPADRNVISGSEFSVGIMITGAGATGNAVWGNFIGTNADGVSAHGNVLDGVHISSSASNNEIGDVVSGRANVIAFNGGDGVNIPSTGGTGNAIRGNSIHSNGSASDHLGIDLELNGVTPNDALDGDTGPNNKQNFPLMTLAVTGGGHTNVHGTLTSLPSTNFFLDFYHSASCDAGGNGEGEVYLGSTLIGTPGSGIRSFAISFPTNVADGRVVTATATRQTTSLDTSEFSNCVTAGAMVVDTTSDDNLTNCSPSAPGDCSLRGALTNASQADTPGDVITFNPTVFPVNTPATITIDGTLNGALPALNDAAGQDRIDGTGAGVVLDGAGEPSPFTCLSIESDLNVVDAIEVTDCLTGINLLGDNNIITENVIYDNGDANGGTGIAIASNRTGNVIKRNHIGTNEGGTAVHPSGGNRTGITIQGTGNTIGGLPLDRNVISGNLIGLSIASGNVSGAGNNNIVRRNYIGTDITGSVDLGNTVSGISIFQAVTGNIIGGPGGGNVISGNDQHGVRLFGNDNFGVGRPSGNIIQGNLIGTNDGGTADLGNGTNGILIDGAINTCIGGAIVASVCVPGSFTGNLISGNDNTGVEIVGDSPSGNKLFGNNIGTDFPGTSDLGNSQHGVNIEGGSTNVVGSPLGPNVISGNNQNGVRISGGASNLVEGNLIGTTASGTVALGNSNQNVRIDNSGSNSVFGNVIAASGDAGVRVSGTTNDNGITGNFIGVDATGTIPLGNASHGVHIASTPPITLGTFVGLNNVIAHNGGDGVYVESSTKNTITNNSIHSNNGLGVDLGPDGVTANDPNDGDTGGNDLMNFPVLTSVVVGGPSTTFNGTLDTVPGAISSQITLRFYSSPSCDASGFGEGATFLGNATYDASATGDLTFSSTFPVVVPSGRSVTATAMNADGSTSEFSACIPSVDDADDDDDGFTDAAEALIGTGSLDPCGNDGWPSDLAANNILNIADIGSFLSPARTGDNIDAHGSFNYFNHALDDDGDTVIESNENPDSNGGANDPPTYNVARWNLQVLPGDNGATQINIGDLGALITGAAGSPARPPMFGNQPAFFTDVGNGVGGCPFPP